MYKQEENSSTSNNTGITVTKNALALNLQMQEELLKYRQTIQNTLQTIHGIYNVNEELLKKMMMPKTPHVSIKGAYVKSGTFYLKGNMFFKDLNCRNCPNNSDYEYRSKKEHELFPMDLNLCSRHVWTLKDKIDVVKAVKEQILEHLNDTQVHCNKNLNNEKLVTLLSYVSEEDFKVDWEQISKYNLKSRHTATSCEALWNVYLKPDLKRSPWTAEENKLLVEAAKINNFQNWTAVAAYVGKRSDFQCFVQFQSRVCHMLPERWSKWCKSDDKRLMDIVAKNTCNNVINWNNVMAHFPHKSKTTIQCRYAYTLNPHVSHAPFTPEEDLLLLTTVKEYGTKFSCFPKTLFPHRTAPQLRSRYNNTIVHRNKMQAWTAEDDKKLLDFVKKYGTSSWLKCQSVLSNHTRTSCRTRYLTIMKYFERHPNAKIEDIPRRKSYTPSHDITPENFLHKLAELQENPEVDLHQSQRKKFKPNKQLVKKCRKYPVYKMRLRNVGLQMYNFYKYSYNYQLGDDPVRTLPDDCYLFKLIAHILQFNLTKNVTFDMNISNRVQEGCKLLLNSNTINCNIIVTCDLIPPNWQSSMAFRALCILAVNEDSIKNEVPCSTKFETYNCNSHINLFRKRMRTLFYLTSLLSRLHPSILDTITSIK